MPAIAAQRNIEIKAKILDAAAFQEKVEIAKKLVGSAGEKIVQHDVFFNVNHGRLKLRYEVGCMVCKVGFTLLNNFAGQWSKAGPVLSR